jgi:hypothetical protein
MSAPATAFPNLKRALERIEASFGEAAHRAEEAVERELATAQQEAMAFLDGLKAHIIQ